MKKFLFTFFILHLSFFILHSQAPYTFKYQAITRDAQGNIIANQQIVLKISIIQGSMDGQTVYAETHTVTTNEFGLINIDIGKGRTENGEQEDLTGYRLPATGYLKDIDWSQGLYFLKIEIDPEGGSDFKEMGTSQLLSVPYALYAETAGNSGTRAGEWNNSGGQVFLDEGTFPGANVGIGTTVPGGRLHVQGPGFSGPAAPMLFVEHGAGYSSTFRRVVNNAGNALFLLQKARGSTASPSAVQKGDNIGQIRMEGYDGTGYVEAGYVRVLVDDAVTTGSVPGAIVFATAPTGSSVCSERVRISSNGNLGIGTSNPLAKVHVIGDVNLENGNIHIPVTSSSAAGAIWQGGNLFLHSKGTANTFLGDRAGNLSLSGELNTSSGYFSLQTLSTGSNNTAFGAFSLYSITTGAQNTSVGSYAGQDLSDGHNNVYAGYEAGQYNQRGSCNTYVGAYTGSEEDSAANNVFIGYSAGHLETGSNKLYIENSGNTDPLIYGEFNNDYVKINGDLEVTQSFIDSNSDPGSSGQILRSTGSGTDWIDPSTISDGDWTISGNDLYTAVSGNVGIGTTLPGQTLDINGDLYTSERIGIGGINTDMKLQISSNQKQIGITQANGDTDAKNWCVQAGNGQFKIQAVTDNWSGWNTVFFLNRNGTVIDRGGINSAEKFGFCDAYPDAVLEVSADNGSNDLFMLSSDDNTDGNRMIVKNNGNAGIGDSGPDAVLEVSASGEANDLFMLSSDDNNDGNRMIVKNNGNVGIGATDPFVKFDVNSSSIRIRTASPPATNNADGYTGEIRWGQDYIYVCTSGDGPGGSTDFWKRAALSSW